MRLSFRLPCLLLSLGVGVISWELLKPQAPHAYLRGVENALVSAPADQETASTPQRKVRIVYADATTAGSPIGPLAVDDRADMVVASIIPAQPSTRANEAGSAGASGQGETAEISPPRLSVDLNTASVAVLNGITGGGSIGRMIVAHRPYRSVDDLLNKRVVRRSVFDRIKHQVAAE